MNRAPGKFNRPFIVANRLIVSVALSLLALSIQLSPPATAQTNPWTRPGMTPPWQQPPQSYHGESHPRTHWPSPPQSVRRPTRQPNRNQAQATLAVTIEATNAYVHQGLVLTLETVSEGNLRSLDVTLPRSKGVIFRELGTPSARAETRNGKRRIVNLRHYHLIPLQPGRLSLAPVEVNGSFTDGGSFQAKAPRGIDLDVLPPEGRVKPWLPLHDLQLSAQLLDDEVIDEGRPLKIIIEQRAIGMVGAQLPSPEKQLKGNSHRLYREGTQFEALIAPDGRLTGRRTDRFTLVPLKQAELVIPEVSVAWWNVDKKRRELSIIPSRRLATKSAGRIVEEALRAARRADRIALETPLIWISIIALAFFAGLGWRRVTAQLGRWDSSLFRGRLGRNWGALREHVGSSIAHGYAPLGRFLQALHSRLSPRRLYHRGRTFLANSLPRPLRLWFCVRTVQLETNPEDWASVLRFVLARRLGISAQKPMGALAAEIADIHPGSDRQRLAELMQQLEAAAFGKDHLADFEAWKRDFMRQISPHPWTWFKARAGRRPKVGLPALNPEFEGRR